MAPQLKLIYFPLEGRGECIRLIAAAGGVPLMEEEIITFEQWPARKDGKRTIANERVFASNLTCVDGLANLLIAEAPPQRSSFFNTSQLIT